MQHLTASGKSVLVGDATADVLIRYAAHLSRLGSADDVALQVIGPDGSHVVLTLLLNAGTLIVAETTHSDLPEPDNADTIAYMETQMAQYDLPSG